MGIIVSSFPGCGREYLKNTHGNKVKIIDFIPEQNKEIDATEFVNNVMNKVGEYDIVFIGINKEIREELESRNIDYDIFYPAKERRGEFIENFVRKREKPAVIQNLDRNFDKWVDEIDSDESTNCYKHFLKNNGEFMGTNSSIMQYITSLQENLQKNE